MMGALPDRVYASDAAIRRRLFAAESMAHPAKLNARLAADLCQRYLRPGMVVLDPFAGIGTMLLACLYGCDVLLCELEAKFCGWAAANASRIRGQQPLFPDMPVGSAVVVQCDSRHLPLWSAHGCVTSPPYADTLIADEAAAEKYRARLYERPIPPGPSSERGLVFQLLRGAKAAHLLAGKGGYSRDLAQIGGLAHGDVRAIVSSPPFGNLASRQRSQEPYAQANPERERAYGGAPNRHVDGYSEDERNIGNSEMLDTKRRPQPPEGQETYAAAVLQVYTEACRVVCAGGILVLVVGNYVRDNKEVPLAEDTIRLAVAAGWTPVERWRALKTQVSFWRILHQQRAAREGSAAPLIACEHVLVFCKGPAPAWTFHALPPTRARPFALTAGGPQRSTPGLW